MRDAAATSPGTNSAFASAVSTQVADKDSLGCASSSEGQCPAGATPHFAPMVEYVCVQQLLSLPRFVLALIRGLHGCQAESSSTGSHAASEAFLQLRSELLAAEDAWSSSQQHTVNVEFDLITLCCEGIEKRTALETEQTALVSPRGELADHTECHAELGASRELALSRADEIDTLQGTLLRQKEAHSAAMASLNSETSQLTALALSRADEIVTLKGTLQRQEEALSASLASQQAASSQQSRAQSRKARLEERYHSERSSECEMHCKTLEELNAAQERIFTHEIIGLRVTEADLRQRHAEVATLLQLQ